MNEVEKLILISGKTAKELAPTLNTSETQISRYRSGKFKITVELLKEWCRILNIDIKKLFN
ncbi:helix-turn-helix domain-containing protein [Riemerella anatipestifer]|uniref:helix-turn-helix domain-containing protein n=1 Tax=Riemerella anatipestifer TaxID=34085 RepID=UPI0007ED780C|nr:helix-turn-helix transcriptional regulator [Riemerella anatipestifer]MCU7570494.1 helix-turn-helix transcriptional regulator [Riemerella anatipestifer]MCW0507927.1 helix-turn-helix transcriptional regulator [Riemerella anatipestifer]MDR7846615.1 helix-turn-helix transcriptional regulator [Riemerella anatipestifer]MDY3524969.1 helix-turn-helix transcriptional regulator [Riemerella anatipestifer]OBP46987.1 transcriptional regulator [Riemerella anatipestifer]